MSIGVCYFPEHWPDDRWETDVERMAAAGIEYVRMAEFSWGVLEPERNEFDFEWLERAIELIDEHGMKVVLCTPTASPPRWLVDERPEILQRERDGTVKTVGSRRHYCFNSPAYREETERVVRTMAERYAGDPRIVGWQTDNEYGCHGTADCYCEDCGAAFREWLDDRYEDADDLDEKWGLTFWSQQYDGLADVDVPKPTPAQDHPSYALEFRRFTSDSIVEYNRLQTDLLREYDDDWFVTHNFMNLFPSIDLHEMGEDLDLISWDSYPTGHVQGVGEASHDQLRAGDPDLLSFNHDVHRSVLDRPFWVMEQQPGDVNWPPHSTQPAEGAMRLWAHHATAHGADSVVYFRWRRCLGAQEQYHAGLRKGDGSADRGYHDARQAARELAEIEGDGEAEGLESPAAPVAILHDYENYWAIAGQEHAPDFDYWSLLRSFYEPLRARGVNVDVVHPERDLEGYDAVVAPGLHLVTDDLVAHLTDYVENGGQLLFGPRTGVKDEYNAFRPAPQPGPLADLVGATVDQHESAPEHLETTVTAVEGEGSTAIDGEELSYRTWAEWLVPDAAEPIFEYTSEGVTGGKTAVVHGAVDDGTVVYCGVQPEADLGDRLIDALLERASVSHAERLPKGVRATERDGLTWVCNFTGEGVAVETDEPVEWRLGGPEIDPFGVSIAANDVIEGLVVRSVTEEAAGE